MDDSAISAPLKLGRLDRLLGFHLRMASAAVARDFAAAIAELDLTQKQFAVLELIAANSGASQVDIGQTLGTDRATMMAIVDRLDARSLIMRQRSARDGRRQELSLTEAGIDLLATARERIAAHEKRFWAVLGKPGTQELLTTLRRIHDAG